MGFLQPTYFWGLLAVLVPLVIHLLNKGDVKTIKVGSVRYLTEQETKQTRQVKLNELLLLFLRMLLLALFVFIMAQPVVPSKSTRVPLTYLMEPSVLQKGQMDAVLKDAQGVPKRVFAKDFPVLDMDNIPNEVPKYWQLAQALQNLESDSIVVFSTASITGMQGIRPAIPKNVHWMVLDEENTTDSLVGATAVKDGAILHAVKSDASYTDIVHGFISKDDIVYGTTDSISITQNDVQRNIPLSFQDTLRIALAYGDDFLKDKDLLTAAFKAIADYTQMLLVVDEVSDTGTLKESDFDLFVWLKRSAPPIIKGKLLQYRADSLATRSIQKTAQKYLFYLTERLTIDKVLHERLTEELIPLVMDTPKLQEIVVSLDKRTMPEAEFLPMMTDLDPVGIKQQQRSIVNWFWIATLLVLGVERVLAKFRKQ